MIVGITGTVVWVFIALISINVIMFAVRLILEIKVFRVDLQTEYAKGYRDAIKHVEKKLKHE